MTTEERYKECLEGILKRLNIAHINKCPVDLMQIRHEVDNALTPPEEWVEEEDVAYRCPVCKRLYDPAELIQPDTCCSHHSLSATMIVLTGTRKVRKPATVTRREEIIVRCGDYQLPTSREYRSFTGLEKIYREWQETI